MQSLSRRYRSASWSRGSPAPSARKGRRRQSGPRAGRAWRPSGTPRPQTRLGGARSPCARSILPLALGGRSRPRHAACTGAGPGLRGRLPAPAPPALLPKNCEPGPAATGRGGRACRWRHAGRPARRQPSPFRTPRRPAGSGRRRPRTRQAAARPRATQSPYAASYSSCRIPALPAHSSCPLGCPCASPSASKLPCIAPCGMCMPVLRSMRPSMRASPALCRECRPAAAPCSRRPGRRPDGLLGASSTCPPAAPCGGRSRANPRRMPLLSPESARTPDRLPLRQDSRRRPTPSGRRT